MEPRLVPRRGATRQVTALRIVRLPLVLLLLNLAPQTLAAAPAGGDALAELNATLARFPATDPIGGSLELELARHSKMDNYDEQAKVTVEVEDGPQGIRIGYSRSVLQQALQESRNQAIDADLKTPTVTAMRAVDATEVAEVVDLGSYFRRELTQAQLVEARPGSYQGKPARLLVIRLRPHLSATARKHVKSTESTLSIWLGEDGLPLGAERVDRNHASFLLLSFENSRRQSWACGHKGNRIFAYRHQVEDFVSGLGQNFQNRTATALTVR